MKPAVALRLSAFALLSVACAAAPPPTSSAPPGTANEASDAEGPRPTAAPGTDTPQAGTTSVKPTSAPNNPVPPVAPSAGAARSWALANLGESEQRVEASLKECTTACKALASMERAAKSLCDLGDAGECARAKERVEAARDKVKRSCGVCPASSP